MKRILMIAYHFPPMAGSSGIQRTLRFVRHLPHFGWQPLVLTANARAYERTSADLLADVPAGTVVRRAFALDTARHLALGGRYIASMARPDRWISWKLGAVRAGLSMIKTYRPDALWSTYPIATAHLIGAELHRRTGIPWLADFRDPMAQEGYPADPLTWQCFKDIEREAVGKARFSVFTTPGAARVYRQRYPEASERIVVLENGYDEESFSMLKADELRSEPIHPGTLTLLHSGLIYPEERDPTELMVALRLLKESGGLAAGELTIRFRAAGHEQLLRQLAETQGVADFIECCPPVAYREALSEMLRADGLLVMQAAGCNEQIPAKIYEYLRAQRPIIALTDPAGDTATTLGGAGVKEIAPLDSATAIAALLARFLGQLKHSEVQLPHAEAVRRASRRERTGELARLLDSL
jgi:glycosyltransferase involved in cell wall biosynthesis